ncbi:hypothetical protein P691DRAFT_635602, partial [Macrolepiota fuliginosa MF-IS2]
DGLLTFEMEISFIWQAPWTLMKGLYLLERYSPFVDVALGTLLEFGGMLSGKRCQTLYRCTIWMYCFGIAIANLIFTLRTWIVWGKHQNVGIGLAISYVTMWAIVLFPIGVYLQSLT